MTEEEKVKIITDVLKKHPYIKAMRKAFRPSIYRPLQYIKYTFNIKIEPFSVNEEDEFGWFGKRFNRKHWLVKRMFKIRKMAQMMSRKEIEWCEEYQTAEEGDWQ